MQKKFGVLRIVSAIYKVIAWIVLVLGVLGGCVSFAVGVFTMVGGAAARNSTSALPLVGVGASGLIGGLGIILIAVLYFLLLYALGDVVSLLISLEENTRLTAERLAGQPATIKPI